MATRFAIAALLFMNIQAVFFGIGAILILATPLADVAMRLFPWMVAGTTLLAAPISWWLAPRLRARYWRRGPKSEADRALQALS